MGSEEKSSPPSSSSFPSTQNLTDTSLSVVSKTVLMAGYGTSGSEEILPELLKNTPSNIAKLEDVIEHFRGRQKYLAQTRSPSDGGDVRWYFCKVPLATNELAASFPRAEIVDKGEYFRFGMRDSLAIEASFLQREEELLSSWWKEFAECSKGPGGQAQSKKKLNGQDDHVTQVYEIEEERVGVPVKGGLYEVDLVRRHCFPVYWSGENRRVLRGHWFASKGGLDWLPLREDVAEQLEIAYHGQVWHRRTFQPSGLFAARVELQGSTPGLYALFKGEDDTWEAWLNMDSSGFSSFINFRGSGIKLRRGYFPSNSPKPTQDEIRQQQEEEMDDYCSQVPVRHLVFMVHGIGQRLEKSNLVDDVGNFRHITASLAELHLTSHQRGTQRVLFIPCQWRKGLKLSGETAVEKITLDGVRGLRVMLSATVHDILYYMSPIYCQDIIDSVSNQLNRLYLKFLKRNPSYDGKVSIYGHSLGTVLSYDILCHQEFLSGPFPMKWMFEEHNETQGNSFDMKDDEAATSDLTTNQKDEDHHLVNDTQDMTFMKKDNISTLQTPDSATTQIHSSELDGLIEAKSKSEDDTDKMGDSDGDNDKERIIKRLKEEVESLKTRIAEMESYGDGDMGRGSTSEHPRSLKLQPAQDDASKSYTPYINYTKLEFKVDTFFCVGSPLGVFLSLRNIRIGIGKGKEYWDEENISEEMPACRQMFNIFHPYDPVAYRIEPLVCKEYISKRPVLIPYHRGGKRLHIGLQEFTEDLAARSRAVVGHLNFVKVKVLTLCQSKNLDRTEEDESCQEKEERSYGSLMIERLTGTEGGRVDHMLQDKTFEHPYLQAIGSHTNYWRDNDTALFILKHLYRDIPEEPESQLGSCDQNPKNDDDEYPALQTNPEQLPLMFSEKPTDRNFSRKSNKSMSKY